MDYEYHPCKLGKQYEDERWLKKKFNPAIAEGMMKFIGAVRAASSAYDIKTMPQFYMEHKKGNLKEYYFVSLDKKKSKWRLPLQMLDENGKAMMPTEDEPAFLRGIKKIRILEMSDHYGEY